MNIPEPHLSRIRTYVQRIHLYTQLAKTEEALIAQEIKSLGVDVDGDVKYSLDIEQGLLVQTAPTAPRTSTLEQGVVERAELTPE